MKATLFFRIACVVMILFAVGHTLGSLTLKAPTAEAQAVRESMDQVHFRVRGAEYSFGGFYIGMSLSLSVYMLFSALVAGQLARLAGRHPEPVAVLGWGLCGVQVAGLVLCCLYFSVVPAVFSAVAAVCLGWGSWLAQARVPRATANAVLTPA